jgi:DNA-directed RNA polymerase subunit RPC12/RpoP
MKCSKCGEELEIVTTNYDGVEIEPYYKCPRCRTEYDIEEDEEEN